MTPDTAPNKAFTGNPAAVSDNVLISEFGFDGGVLEIAIGAGAFQGIVSAGGSFITGGYNGTISLCCSDPRGSAGVDRQRRHIPPVSACLQAPPGKT